MTKKPEERKQEIIDTAKKLFAERGYKATQVKDIVGEIGVAQGLFYYYFKSKEEVMEAVAEDYADSVFETITISMRSKDTCEHKIFKIFDAFINTAKEQSNLFKAIQIADNGIIHEKILCFICKKLIPLVTSIVKDGIAREEMGCDFPELSTQILVNGIFSILNEIAMEEKIIFLTDNMEALKNIIRQTYGITKRKEE